MYYLNAEKTGYMAYKQYGVIIPLRHKDLKQLEDLIYLGSSIVITEKDVYIHIDSSDKNTVKNYLQCSLQNRRECHAEQFMTNKRSIFITTS